VELRAPESPHDKIEQKPAAYARAAKDPEVLTHFQGIVTSWCDQITKYMEDDPSNQPIDPKVDSGPDVEIEYWSRRMLTLISITEQLKTKPSRVVTGVLKARALRSEPGDSNPDENALSEQEKIKNLIERWREVDLAITDSLNESKDNVRFLENLRKVIEPLYTESPKVIADAMPSLMNSMKMIHTLSRHYGTEVRMTNLFERITNQLIVRCKSEVYSKQNVAFLWKQNPQGVMEKMNSCIVLCETYHQYYKDTKAKLAEMPKGKQFNFDENAIFGKLTRFRRRLEKLIDMFSSIEQFKALREKRIDSMEPLLDSFDELVNEFKVNTPAHTPAYTPQS
jgi:dynein heavy chain